MASYLVHASPRLQNLRFTLEETQHATLSTHWAITVTNNIRFSRASEFPDR